MFPLHHDFTTGFDQNNIDKPLRPNPNCYEVLAKELKEYGTIASAIRVKSRQLEEMANRAFVLDKQKQELNAYCDNAKITANQLTKEILHLYELLNRLANETSNNFKAGTREPPLIMVMLNNSFKKEENKGKE